MRSGALLLVLLSAAAGLAAATERDGVFVGYKEVGVDGGGGDGSLHADEGGAAAGSGAGADSDAASNGDAATAVGRTVLLHTQFGPIRVKMLEQLAPRTTALVWDLAQRRGCRDCAFYRRAGPGGHQGSEGGGDSVRRSAGMSRGVGGVRDCPASRYRPCSKLSPLLAAVHLLAA